MSYDGLFTHLMVKELQENIIGGRISKIHQPYDNELMFVVRHQGKNHTLLLSAHPSYARVQLTNISYINPSTPPNFCMVMRKYLEGSILNDVTQIDNDRVLEFSFSTRNELGDLEDLILVVELMGRHSNIILKNQETDKIIDAIKHVGSSQNTYRSILPGAAYIAPPKQTSINPFETDNQKLFEFLNTRDELTSADIQSEFQGFGKDSATELAYRINQNPKDKYASWHSFFDELLTRTAPTLMKEGKKEIFAPIPFHYLDQTIAQYDTLSELLDGFYEGKAEKDRVSQQANDLIRKVKNDQQKLKKKIKKLNLSLKEADNAELYRIKGELITANIHQINRSEAQIYLPNYYDNNELLRIDMNIALTANQNAQKYFQKYQKLKSGVKKVLEQIEKAQYDLYYLESVEMQLDLATPKDLDIIREELVDQQYIKVKHKGKKKPKQNKKSLPEEFVASDGTLILVGKNNLQNDQLTLKTARKTDVWLHAKDIPGSHVIIKEAEPSEETLEEAAILAAYYSKYRLSSRVPVDYVQVKHVKKPNGAKPGYVIYENQQTLFVTPDKEKVISLKRS